jgi:glucosamine 6-phosphate synthetase-like amidotransferase/phosphosugar isomerase protein
MCGLHGTVSGTANLNADDFVRDSFTANMLRGVDSAGIATINAKQHIHKLAVSGNVFTTTSAFKSLLPEIRNPNTATICHTRAATVGAVTVDNSHPFTFEKDGVTIIGAHNGTVSGWHTAYDGNQHNNDSSWLINKLLVEGDACLSNITGAFALVWWRSDTPDKIYFARNKGRPLHIMYTEEGNMLYASEAGMLHWVAERTENKRDGDIYMLEEEHVYTINIEDPREFTKKKIDKVVKVVHSPPTNYSTMMQKIRALLPSNTNQLPLITSTEKDLSDMLNITDEVGDFYVYGKSRKDNHWWGELDIGVEGGTLSAVCRIPSSRLQNNAIITVKVVGAYEKNNDYTIVVEPTYKKALVA